MWGLGCILLEIVHGIPLWLSNKVKIKIDGVEQSKCGIFATENRSYSEILKKQLELIKNIDIFLVEEVIQRQFRITPMFSWTKN